MFEGVLDDMKTEEICLEAVKDDGWNIKFIPEHMRTEKICLIAIRRDINTYRYIPENIINMNLYLNSLQNINEKVIF